MINVTKTYLPDRKKFDDYVNKIYNTGWLTNNGSLHKELESKLKDYLGVENLLLVSNGTLALQIAFRALDLKGEVITTPFSFAATTSSLAWEKLKPVFADININTFNIEVEGIEEKITKNTSAILPVHVFGNACDVISLEEIASKNNLKLIFDAAHAFGVKGFEKSILSYGDASILSFHSTKIFHTIEGGAIIFKSKEHLEKARLLINFGISGYDKIDSIGINAKMNEFQAAMGLCVLDEMEKIIQTRKDVYNYYEANLISQELSKQKNNDDFTKNYAYYPIVFATEDILLKVKSKLNNMDIHPRRYFYPSLNTLDYIEYQKCEKSESLASRILCLPIYSDLSTSQIDTIIETILYSI